MDALKRRYRAPRRIASRAGALVMALGLALAGCAPGAAPVSLRGSLTISGSTALQPLVTRAAQTFTAVRPEAHITVSGGGSLAGLQAVNSGKVTIGDSDVYADPGTYPDPTLSDHLVAVIPFTLITNTNVTGITSLKRDQIIGIFSTGQYTNWSQLGGPNLPIQAVVRPPTSGTRLTFRKYVMGGRDEKGIFLKSDSSKTVLETVASTPGAIGYLAVSVLDSSVRAIGIDGENATPAAIEGGRYPFWGYEHMYTLGDGSALSSAFLAFMTTPAVQAMAQGLGYIPIYDMRLASETPVIPVALAAAMAPDLRKRRADG